MPFHPTHFLTSLIAPGPSHQMREVFQSTAIRSLAISAVGIFEPIYLYSIGFSLSQIMLYFAAIFFLRLLLIPIGARVCRRHGYEHTILFSSPFLVLHYVALLAIPSSPLVATALSGIFLSIYFMLYWPSYHANFAASSRDGEIGREVSNNIALSAIASALAPAVAAGIIILFGYQILFALASILVLLANVPLLRTPEVFMPQDFPYWSSFGRAARNFFKPQFLAYIGLGEQVVAIVVWPIFLAVSLSGVIAAGLIVALARLVNVLVTLYVGRLADEEGQKALLRSGSFFTVASWLVRPLLVGPLGMFLIDSYYQISSNMTSVPFFSLMYRYAREGSTLSSVVLGEMGITFGKFSICLILAAVFAWSPFDPWKVSFLVAAVYAIFYTLLPLVESRRKTNQVSNALLRTVDPLN